MESSCQQLRFGFRAGDFVSTLLHSRKKILIDSADEVADGRRFEN